MKGSLPHTCRASFSKWDLQAPFSLPPQKSPRANAQTPAWTPEPKSRGEPGNPYFKQDVQMMLLPGGFRIPALGCKTLAVRDCTFDLCKPRTSPPAWDISRQSAVCQSSKGVSPSLQRQQESSQSHGWGYWSVTIAVTAPQASPSFDPPVFGVSAPRSDFIQTLCLPGWEERRWFVFKFTKPFPNL